MMGTVEVLHGRAYVTMRGMRALGGAMPAGHLPIGMLRSFLELDIRKAVKALPPARPVGEFGEPWRPGLSRDAIVSDANTWADTMSSRDNLEYYGGELVAESMTSRHRDRAIACVNFCAGERVPSASLTEILDLLDAAATGLYIGPGSMYTEIRDAAMRVMTESGRNGGASCG